MRFNKGAGIEKDWGLLVGTYEYFHAKVCFLPCPSRVCNGGTEVPPPAPGSSLTVVVLVSTETTNFHPSRMSWFPLGWS